MKKAMLLSVFAMVMGSGVIAQTAAPAPAPVSVGSILSDLTGLQVLRIVANERKLIITDARLVSLRSTPPADREFIQLCLSKITYDALVISQANLVARVLVTRAALEAASCKTFSTSGVQGFINSGVLRPIVTAEDLANFIRNPIFSGINDINGVNATPSRP